MIIETTPIHPSAPGRSLADRDGRILVADDDEDTRALLDLIFRQAGWRPTLVGNGREAVEKASSRSYMAALLDVAMPVLSGLDAARIIRVSWPEIALAFHTSMEESWVTSRFDGHRVFLRKPVVESARIVHALRPLMEPGRAA